jgi:uncharacterized surface anchored protein
MSQKIFKSILAFALTFAALAAALPLIPCARASALDTACVYIDGKPVAPGDERIQNTVTVTAPKRARTETSMSAAASVGATPNVSMISGMADNFERDPDVTMDGHKVSARRYIATVDNIGYEAYCGDPKLRGPEIAGAIYELSGPGKEALRNALKNGFPINTEWSDFDSVSQSDRMWLTYVTRVAVAMANNPASGFAGDAIAIEQARQLAGGSVTADPGAYPPIAVNGEKDADDTGRAIRSDDAQSMPFEITYNRKTNNPANPFRFEWAAGTPGGAKLIVDGNAVATAPENPDTVYGEGIKEFQIEMPNSAEYAGKTAAVNLVGIHNGFADTVWLLQNPSEPDLWQDILFYIPEVSASASFSFEADEDSPGETGLRIIKRDSSGKGLAGAVFEITGPNGYSKQAASPANGTIKLTGLEPGEYTIKEVAPPSGYKLASPADTTVTIAPDQSGVVEKVFVNEPDKETPPSSTSVKIQKIDALTRENIPGALIRLRGISSSRVITEDGQIREIDNTGINLSQVLTAGASIGGDVTSTVTDGVWTLTGLPYGAYVAEEERAPENYSLLPQHTSYSFWLLPGNVTIKLNQDESAVYTDDVLVSVREALNAAIAGIQNYDDAEGLAEELQGILDTLLSRLKVDAVFTVEVDQSVNSQLITFENYPFGKIEVTKYDMVSELPLAGAHIRIQGYFAEGNTNGMPIDRVGITGADGKLVFEDLPAGQYTISETEAPDGYELSKPSFRSISLTWGQTNSTSFYNKPKTRLEVIKADGITNAKLAGAVFRLTDPTTGEFWEGETAADGRVLLGAGGGSRGNQLESETAYILTEIQAPPGYVLDPSPREVVLGANNIPNSLTFANLKKPTLTVIKYDELTNLPLAGASFRLWKTEGETWSETQITDANGVITWTDLDPGIYSVQEIDEPYGYFKDPARKEILLQGGDSKQLEFFNRPRPVLTILKRDAVTGEPLPNVKFKVQKSEGETIGEFLTDANGRIELSPKTDYLLEEAIYRVTELLPPNEYLLDPVFAKDVMLKWQEPTELIFENLLKPTLIFIKRDGMSGRGISGATYKIEYESPTGGVTNIGSYVTKCGLIVVPYVLPGWYSLTETIPASGYRLPTNPTQRLHLAPGENSYTHAQTHEDLYVDARTNPNNGQRGMCGDWCGYLCSVLCAGNCGNAGDGTMANGGSGGAFGNMVITNGNGETLGNTGGGTAPTDTAAPTLAAGTVNRTGNFSATIQFTSSEAGRYYTAYTSSGGNVPTISTLGTGTVCSAGLNTVAVSLTTGTKDLYIKVKDAAGNISDALKIVIPAYNANTQIPIPPSDTPDFGNIVITGGTVVWLNPDFSGITISFGD